MNKNIHEVLRSYNSVDYGGMDHSLLNRVIEEGTSHLHSLDYLNRCFSCIDLTTLHGCDTLSGVKYFTQRVNEFNLQFDLPNVASICVFPCFVEIVRKTLLVPGVNVVSVAGAFPSSQTFLDVKILECQMAVEKGADEIDIVLPLGAFMDGNYQEVYDDIVSMKQACGNARMKVILETGELKLTRNICLASLIAMEAGADFIKTSTGKVEINATLEAAWVMTQCIKEFYLRTGRKVGFKPAGGISSVQDAMNYYFIIQNNLGDGWTNSDLFRIGASSLANNLLLAIYETGGGTSGIVDFF